MSDIAQSKSTQTKVGHVVSNKMDKTIVVLVERLVRHPKYKKYVKRNTKLKAHDDKNQCNEGDKVLIQQTRPISKTKAWCLVEVIETGKS